jgi:hypothetical protein
MMPRNISREKYLQNEKGVKKGVKICGRVVMKEGVVVGMNNLYSVVLSSCCKLNKIVNQSFHILIYTQNNL